jgi:hypothetical protein
MPSRFPRPSLSGLALGAALALLAAPAPAAAAPLLGSASHPGQALLSAPADLLAGAWAWLESFWPDAGRRVGPGAHPAGSGRRPRLRPDLGCGMDPNGTSHCTGGARSLPPPNLGCGIDPNGKPLCTGGSRWLHRPASAAPWTPTAAAATRS